MTSSIDYNALLLKVMAHDLLAPLTAVKWQTELLERSITDRKKTKQYIEGIANSTELGITLTRHAHVAARVLGGGYEGAHSERNLSEVIKESIVSLRLQYERHGLKLGTELEDNEGVEELDDALLGLFIWSVGKFFLTCTPPGTSVFVRGVNTEEEKYVFSISASEVKEREVLVGLFSSDESAGRDFDQTFVFVKLLQEIAPQLHASVSVEQDADFFAVTIVFAK